jgi:hypothetical protein
MQFKKSLGFFVASAAAVMGMMSSANAADAIKMGALYPFSGALVWSLLWKSATRKVVCLVRKLSW